MKCPNCNETLVMADRQGVEIDYCPKCRGVWLDRGELDKIIERAAAFDDSEQRSFDKDERKYDDDRRYDNDRKYDDEKFRSGGQYNDPKYRHRKKKGFFGDFFDFD